MKTRAMFSALDAEWLRIGLTGNGTIRRVWRAGARGCRCTCRRQCGYLGWAFTRSSWCRCRRVWAMLVNIN